MQLKSALLTPILDFCDWKLKTANIFFEFFCQCNSGRFGKILDVFAHIVVCTVHPDKWKEMGGNKFGKAKT